MTQRTTKVVAISRAAGAEGERIGALVAERLGFRYVDEEMIAKAAEKQGVDPAAIADAERRKGVIQRVLEGLRTERRGRRHARRAVVVPRRRDRARPEPRPPSLNREILDEIAAKGDV